MLAVWSAARQFWGGARSISRKYGRKNGGRCRQWQEVLGLACAPHYTTMSLPPKNASASTSISFNLRPKNCPAIVLCALDLFSCLSWLCFILFRLLRVRCWIESILTEIFVQKTWKSAEIFAQGRAVKSGWNHWAFFNCLQVQNAAG